MRVRSFAVFSPSGMRCFLFNQRRLVLGQTHASLPNG
jgi:hypothetical protein